jgi:hypothetical protein
LSIVHSSLSGKSNAWPSLYAAVGLTTAATLVLELALTRIFSVVFYYHFAFLAISIALFGMGAGGVLSYYITARGTELFRRLGVVAALDALAVVVALVLTLQLAGRGLSAWVLTLVYVCTAIPFLLSGMTVALALAETVERVGRVYFFDLLGAAAGCLLVIPFLNLMGGPGAVLCAAVLYAASAAVWFGLARASAGRALGVALALALVALVLVDKSHPLVSIRSAKGDKLGDELFVQWNSFSRVALRDGTPPQIVIDADTSTAIPTFDLDHLSDAERAELAAHGPGFAYRLRPGAKALIIGAGGGWDVARALASGSKDVTAVEINPIIAETIMRGRFRALSRDLYFRPGVRVVIEDGRSYVRSSREHYQLIQATLVDTWATTAAGAYALSENNIYTTEAFVDYLSHLSGDGLLSLTRWGFDPPRESLRLLSLARESLTRLGAKDPARHVIVVREESRHRLGRGMTDTVLISREPFRVEELERAALAAAQGEFEIVYMPGQTPDSAFATLLSAPDPSAFYRSYPFNVAPATDDRPFFFYTVHPRDVWSFGATADHASADFQVNLAVPTLVSLVCVSLGATLVMLLLPPLVLGARLGDKPGLGLFLAYFLFLGAGYILVQVGLIQKLVLLLGHPTYALTVVIFSMLIWSGLGSSLSQRVVGDSDRRLMVLLGVVTAAVAGLAFSVTLVVQAGAGLMLPVKMLISALFIAPAAFPMGMAFPCGLARLDRWHRPAVRWAWSLNAAASVLGSCAAVFLAITIGLRATLLVGSLLYALALVMIPLSRAAEQRTSAG